MCIQWLILIVYKEYYLWKVITKSDIIKVCALAKTLDPIETSAEMMQAWKHIEYIEHIEY